MRTTLKNFTKVLSVSALLLFAGSCQDDEPTDETLDAITLSCDSFESSNPDHITNLADRVQGGVDYIIDCDIDVEIDLTIDAGVTIQFADNVGMWIQETGSIVASGTSSKAVTFTGKTKAKGAWRGIYFESDNVNNKFNYVTVEYAGGGQYNSNGDKGSITFSSNTTLVLNNVTVTNGLTYGINLAYRDHTVELNNCSVSSCDIPLFIDATSVSKITGGSFTGNTTNSIFVNGESSRSLNTNHTWKDLGVPYRLTNDLKINDGGVLTLNAGVTIEVAPSMGIDVEGIFDDGSAMIAVGTSSNPITFTGVTKTAGSWRSIYYSYSSNPVNKIDNAVIEYAGGNGTNAKGAVEMWSADPSVNISNTSFNNIYGCAIFDYNTASNPNPNFSESNNSTSSVSGGYICNN